MLAVRSAASTKYLETVKIYGNKPSIHAVDATRNTGVMRKKIRDVN